MRYAVIIEKAEHNYSAWVPDMPGCIATGNTAEAAEAAIRDAMIMHLEGLREDGQPFPLASSIVDYVEVAA
jgi:predicted RNase H-like HicB family nuclease